MNLAHTRKKVIRFGLLPSWLFTSRNWWGCVHCCPDNESGCIVSVRHWLSQQVFPMAVRIGIEGELGPLNKDCSNKISGQSGEKKRQRLGGRGSRRKLWKEAPRGARGGNVGLLERGREFWRVNEKRQWHVATGPMYSLFFQTRHVKRKKNAFHRCTMRTVWIKIIALIGPDKLNKQPHYHNHTARLSVIADD